MNNDIDNEFGLFANGIEAMRAMASVVVPATLKRAPLGRRSQKSRHMHRAMPCT